MLIYVKITDRRTDKHIKSIVWNLAKAANYHLAMFQLFFLATEQKFTYLWWSRGELGAAAASAPRPKRTCYGHWCPWRRHWRIWSSLTCSADVGTWSIWRAAWLRAWSVGSWSSSFVCRWVWALSSAPTPAGSRGWWESRAAVSLRSVI